MNKVVFKQSEFKGCASRLEWDNGKRYVTLIIGSSKKDYRDFEKVFADYNAHHKQVIAELVAACEWLSDMATGAEMYAKENAFKYSGDSLCMSEIPTHCPTLGDLRKVRTAIARAKALEVVNDCQLSTDRA